MSPPDQHKTKSIASESSTDKDRDISYDTQQASSESLDKDTSGFTVKISLGGGNACSDSAEDNTRDSGMDVETITFPIDEESRSRQKQLNDKKEAEDDEIMEDDTSLVEMKTTVSATDEGNSDKKEHDVAFESTATPASVKEDTSAEYSTITPSASQHITSKERDEEEEDGSPSNKMMINNTATLTS